MCLASACPAASPVPGNNVQHARRKARVKRQLAHSDRAHRRLLGGFQNHRIAHRQCRRDFPHRHVQRKIPRHDRADHAERLMDRIRQARWARLRDLAVDFIDRLGVISRRLDRQRDVHGARIVDRFSGIERFKQRQFIGVRLELVGERVKHLLLRLDRLVAPTAIFERCATRGDGEVDVGCIARGNLAQRPAVARRDIGKASAVVRANQTSSITASIGKRSAAALCRTSCMFSLSTISPRSVITP